MKSSLLSFHFNYVDKQKSVTFLNHCNLVIYGMPSFSTFKFQLKNKKYQWGKPKILAFF